MKYVLPFLIILILVGFNTKETNVDGEIRGTWKGGFGKTNQITEAFVKFKSGNSIEFYEGQVKESNKCSGSYELLGDTAIVLSYFKPTGRVFVLMEGNINRTKNFVDGTWESNDAKGSFYLQKQK